MLAGVLTALKIIGITLLVILIVVLVLLLLILFVPIRYRLDATVPETELEDGFDTKEIKANARFSWLLHIISGGISYPEQMEFTVKLFGIKLAPKKEKEDKEKTDKDRIKEEHCWHD